MRLRNVDYNMKERTVTVWPRSSRLFKEGDRTITYHKQEVYRGVIVKIVGRNTKDLELYIKTDKPVDLTPGALSGGFGLRGPHECFRFEDQEIENRYRFDEKVTLDLTDEEFKKRQEELMRFG